MQGAVGNGTKGIEMFVNNRAAGQGTQTVELAYPIVPN
jgi:hypothetical protein